MGDFSYLVSVHKWLIYPDLSLLSKFNPRNINYMPVVKFIECLNLEQIISSMDRHYLTVCVGQLRKNTATTCEFNLSLFPYINKS